MRIVTIHARPDDTEILARGARYRWDGFRDMAIFSDDPSRHAVTGQQRDRNGKLTIPDFTIDVESRFASKTAMLATHQAR